MDTQKLDELSKVILDASIAVHREMGPGLLEAVYQYCLVREFELRGITVETQVMVPLEAQQRVCYGYAC